MSNLLTWRSWGLWLMLQTATRGRSRRLGLLLCIRMYSVWLWICHCKSAKVKLIRTIHLNEVVFLFWFHTKLRSACDSSACEHTYIISAAAAPEENISDDALDNSLKTLETADRQNNLWHRVWVVIRHDWTKSSGWWRRRRWWWDGIKSSEKRKSKALDYFVKPW